MMGVQTLFGPVQRFSRLEFQRKLKRPRFVAAILHLILFATMVLAASKPDAFDVRGTVAGFTFWTLCLVDIPVSILVFGILWGAAEADSSASLRYLILFLWGIVGTLWWFLLGLSIEAWIRRFRRKPEAS